MIRLLSLLSKVEDILNNAANNNGQGWRFTTHNCIGSDFCDAGTGPEVRYDKMMMNATKSFKMVSFYYRMSSAPITHDNDTAL